MGAWGRLFRRADASVEPFQAAAIPDGRRVYAIGDVHGRLDLLDRLLDTIAADGAARGAAAATLVFVGDLIDRGPDSAGVVARVRGLVEGGRDVRVIMGNHEEVFLAALEGRPETLRPFLRIGGAETLASYGIAPGELAQPDEALLALIVARVPAGDRAFLAGLEDVVEIGDYAFVHAGIRPGLALEHQSAADLRWIRAPFLEHPGRHGRVIVHGHTIRDEIEDRGNRIGIDTGAYRTGRLTALGLEGSERWLLEASD